MTDEFLVELKNYYDIDQKIREEIEKKLVKVKKNITEVRNDVDDVNITLLLDSLFISLEKLEKMNRSSLSKSSVNEVANRSSLINDIKSNNRKLKNYFNWNINTSNITSGARGVITNGKCEISLNVQDKQKDFGQTIENQKKKEDEMIDEFSGLLKKISTANKEIQNELSNQTPIITNLDMRAVKTKSKVESTTSKLDIYLLKSSNCCLFGFISIEILVIILLLVS